MDVLKAKLKRALLRLKAAVPILLDVAGLGFMTFGVYLIETKSPGFWAILAGIGLILAGLRSQS